MAYRTEKGRDGHQALVIDGWEKGIANSPHTGIASLKNVNNSFLEGATYVNYKRQAALHTGSQTFTAAPSTFTLSSALTLSVNDAVKFSGGSLPSGIVAGTIYFVASVSLLTFTVSTTLGGSALTLGGSGSGTVTLVAMGIPKYFTQSPGTSPMYYIVDDQNHIWQGSYATWTLLVGNHTAGSGLGKGIAYFKNYLFVFGTNYVEMCGNGTGVGGITSANWVNVNSTGYYFINLTSIDLTVAPAVNATSLTLNAVWPYVSGNYQVSIGNGAQLVSGTFTKGSATVPITPKVTVTTVVTTIDVALFPIASVEHMALVGTDDVLYFCNGNTVGSISVTPSNAVFDATNFTTMFINYSALKLPVTERISWLEQLAQNLLVAGIKFIYPWDRISTSFNVPLPINEVPARMINIFNTVYIFAGQKGDIYMTNGYTISLFKRIPDSFIQVIDPSWTIGGMMFHRNKLWFGAVGNSSSGSVKIQGIFSVTLTTDASLNFESQNSYGITPTSSADATGILIDLDAPFSNGLVSGTTFDSYTSAWYNSSAGMIDYNDTTLWSNFEPAIETDLIPIGTFLDSRTFENVEYKLDVPLAEGDAIRLSYRTNFSATYTLVGNGAVTGAAGTTTATSDVATQVISDNFNSNILNAQWVQFLVEFKCASNNSSFIRLREIRLH